IDARTIARTLEVKDRAVSVAGRSEKFFVADGVTYSHIMDPRTGMPAQGLLSVVVLSRTGTEGDALDDAFFVLGVEGSRDYLTRLSEVDVWFFLPDAHGGWTLVDGRHSPARRHLLRRRVRKLASSVTTQALGDV